MKHSAKFDPKDLSDYNKNWRWFLGLGIGLLILGILAICFAAFTTLLSVVILGAFILMGGLFVIIDATQFWWLKRGFYLRLATGILYSLVGLMLIFGPAMGSVALTLLLAVFFILLGIARIVNATSLKYPRWTWSLTSGIITLLLGLFIFAGWPASGLFIIGLFVGIDLMLFGWAYIMLALFAKKSL